MTHVTQYESIIEPEETRLEKWLLHEAAEVYNYLHHPHPERRAAALPHAPRRHQVSGGDPTQLTPSAHVQLTASHGVGQVLVDPRTTLMQSLEAIMMAELADNECWETLTGLAGLAGHEELAQRCEEALPGESAHLLAAGQEHPEVEGEGNVEERVERKPRARPSARKKKTSRRRR